MGSSETRTGIMGGTFNPVHNAHINMAEAAYRQAGLDKVLFMPSRNPPHKKGMCIAAENHRARMVSIAVRDIPYFEYSDFELNLEGTTYSARTLELLCARNPGNSYFFIMGGDSFFQIENWYMPWKIMELAAILVIGRGSDNREKMEAHAGMLKDKYNAAVTLIDMPRMDISSSSIRSIISSGGDARAYMPYGVWEYINENRLYM